MAISVDVYENNREVAEQVASGLICTDPQGKRCSSSNGVFLYLTESGHYNGFCYACQTYYEHEDVLKHPGTTGEGFIRPELLCAAPNPRTVRDRLEGLLGHPYASKYRNCPQYVHRYLGVRMSYSKVYGSPGSVHYPYWSRGEDQEVTGFKTRVLPKRSMFVLGTSKASQLYGQPQASLCENRGWMVATEGEEDMQAVLYSLHLASGRKRWHRVTSLATGGSINSLVNNEEFVRQHDKLLLIHDPDDPGLKCRDKAVSYFGDIVVPCPVGALYPGIKDPDDLLRDLGPKAVQRLVSRAIGGKL